MSESTDIFSVMSVHALDVSTDTAEHVAREHWGIAGRAKALTGERDRNFHFRAEDGREFVLKFANPVEDEGVTDMQIKALRHIARTDPGLPVPRVIALPGGGFETPVPHETGGIQRVRLLSWLPGTNLMRSRRSVAQRVACGRLLARVQVAMGTFTHASTGHELVWDLKHALRIREVMFALTSVTARDRIVPLFDLHWKFGLLCDESAPSRLILVDHIDGPVALLVDSVDEVTVIAREAYQPVRTLGDPAAIGYIRGCVRRDDRLVLWVDHNQLVPNGAVSAVMRAGSRVTDQVG